MDIAFAQIDARDDSCTGYSVCAFIDGNRPASLGPKNGWTAVFMEREYLVRLFNLQEEIRKKYLPLWIGEDNVAEDAYGHGMSEEALKRTEIAAKMLFPGRGAGYYT